jgi:endonuclease/exonuclease/phosphatase family metal-dependent hydrolase
LLTGFHIPDNNRICFINAYGPCTGRRLFWEQVDSNGLLAQENLILVGDLNFTTSIDEVWGVEARSDPLAGFFRDLFQKNHLVDVQPSELVPTWRNGRSGEQNIQKRLDRVYVAEGLLVESTRFRSWVGHPYFSDHAPVFFQLNK